MFRAHDDFREMAAGQEIKISGRAVHSIAERSRERRLSRKRRRLVSTHRRRALAEWLRRTADKPHDPYPGRWRGELLLHDRVKAVRSELHEIASLLERAPAPDPAWIESLHDLLANGCDSPLYNADVHESELRATLYYARAALLACDDQRSFRRK
jgi:hypothetical protein